METEATTATVASAGKGTGNRPLEGMVALVSGGSRGLGRLLSTRLADAGAAVALIARSPGELAAAVGEINRAGGVAAAVSADVTDQRATAAAVAELRERLGAVDIIINNAGISGPVGPAWQARPAEWWQAIEVNLGGAFVLTQLALAQMIPAGGWIRDQFAAGRGADPEAARLILALASGHADRLSGRHLGVTENLDALRARIDHIERDDSYTLRLRT